MKRLADIVERAYAIFDRSFTSSHLDICTDCCIAPEDERRLASMPVRDIPCGLLMDYNDGARTAHCPVDEVKHFLPRYLELVSTFEFPSHSIEVSLTRLASVPDEAWTRQERALLEAFSRTFFLECLEKYPLSGCEIDAIIVMFARANLNIELLLDAWTGLSTLPSALHFRDLFVNGFADRRFSKLKNLFDEPAGVLASQLLHWLESPATRRAFAVIIETSILDGAIDGAETYELSAIYERLVADGELRHLRDPRWGD